MKRNIIETVLGAVVLVVAGSFLIYSTSATSAGTVEGYNITASFNEIGALKTGSDVRVGGVKIGSVEKIDLDPQTYRARATLSIDDNVKLPADTAARVSSEGIMGGNYLALDVGGDEEMIKPGSAIEFTQDAQNLETLLGKFIFSMSEGKDDDKKTSDAAPAAPKAAAPVQQPQAAPAPRSDDDLPTTITPPLPAM